MNTWNVKDGREGSFVDICKISWNYYLAQVVYCVPSVSHIGNKDDIDEFFLRPLQSIIIVQNDPQEIYMRLMVIVLWGVNLVT